MNRLVVGLIGVALAVSACGDSAGAGELKDRGDGQNFVGGDGTVTTVSSSERDEAPALQGTTLAGEPLDLDDYLGQVVVLNVWGSWCTPCRAEAPTLERVYRDLRPQGVEFVGINTRDDEEKARAFERTKNISLSLGRRRGRRAAARVPRDAAAERDPVHAGHRPRRTDGGPDHRPGDREQAA